MEEKIIDGNLYQRECSTVQWVMVSSHENERRRVTRERDEADAYIKALWRNNQLPSPMPESLRDRLAAKT